MELNGQNASQPAVNCAVLSTVSRTNPGYPGELKQVVTTTVTGTAANTPHAATVRWDESTVEITFAMGVKTALWKTVMALPSQSAGETAN